MNWFRPPTMNTVNWMMFKCSEGWWREREQKLAWRMQREGTWQKCQVFWTLFHLSGWCWWLLKWGTSRTGPWAIMFSVNWKDVLMTLLIVHANQFDSSTDETLVIVSKNFTTSSRKAQNEQQGAGPAMKLSIFES